MIRWKNLTEPQEYPVTLEVAKKACRVVDAASVATQANVDFGSGDSQLLIISKSAGTIGNQYSAVVVESGNSTELSVSFANNLITITLATDGLGDSISTVNDVIAALYQSPEISILFDATNGSGKGTGILAAAAQESLSGGVDSGDEDSYIELLIAAATDVIEAYTGKAFIERTVRVYLDSWPTDGTIQLPLSPVSAVDEINYYDSDKVLTEGTDLFEADIEDKDYPARIVLADGEVFPTLGKKVNPIAVDLTVGYGATHASVPAKVKQCVLFLVAHWYAMREPCVNGTAMLSNKVPYTFSTTLNSFRMVTV